MAPSPHYIAFRRACWEDRDLASRMLAEDPTLLEARSGLDETVLHDCAIENGLEAVRFLLGRGASADPRNFAGNSPLQECASICRPEFDLTAVLDLLLRSGSDPYHTSDTMPCAWHSAATSSHPALRNLFASISPPSTRHEDCDFFLGLPDTDDPADSSD